MSKWKILANKGERLQ